MATAVGKVGKSQWESLFGPAATPASNCTCDLIPCLCDDTSEWVSAATVEDDGCGDAAASSSAMTISTSMCSYDDDFDMVLNAEEAEKGERRVALCGELAQALKPHQRRGVSFLWRSIAKNDGCVLADHMGLGKTLQLICLLRTYFDEERHKALMTRKKQENASASYTSERQGRAPPARALVVAPAFVLSNWMSEIARWCPDDRVLCARMLPTAGGAASRQQALAEWVSEGGTLLLGYEMFRQLATAATSGGDSTTKNLAKRALCDPGPGLLILDEAHRLKEPKSQLYRALCMVKTRRRVLASGYPVQNRLDEYWALVSFARSEALGNYEAFRHFFERPIAAHIDAAICDRSGFKEEELLATEATAMRRAYALQTALGAVVLRRGVEELGDSLPPRTDWIVRCALSETQARLYAAFEAVNVLSGGSNGELATYHTALAIVNHPDIIHSALLDEERIFGCEDEEQFKGSSPVTVVEENGGHKGGWVAPELALKKSRAASVQRARDEARRAKQQKKISAQSARKQLSENNNEDSLFGADDELAAYLEAAAEGAELSSWAKPVLRPLILESDPEDSAGYAVGRVDGRFGSGKTAVAIAIMLEAVALGESVIVFTQTLGTLDVLSRMMTEKKIKFRRIDGATAPPVRASIVERFNAKQSSSTKKKKKATPQKKFAPKKPKAPTAALNNGSACDVLLMSIKAGGEGINLTGASRVILFDVCWNPCFDQQAMCRAHRFGQKRPVHVYRLVGPRGTMEERVLRQQRRKELLVREVIEQSDETLRRHVATCVYSSREQQPAPLQGERRRLVGDALLDEVLRSVPGSVSTVHECAFVVPAAQDDHRQEMDTEHLDGIDAFAAKQRFELSDDDKRLALEEYHEFCTTQKELAASLAAAASEGAGNLPPTKRTKLTNADQ